MTNLVILKGNLGADPELHSKNDANNSYVVMSLAVHSRILNITTKKWQNGEVNWFRCVSWNKPIIQEATSLKKGALIRIEGKLRQVDFKDQQGNVRQSIDIIINNMEEIVRHGKKLSA